MTDRSIYCCYAVVALLLYLNYSLLRIRGITVATNDNTVNVPPLLDKRRSFETSCCNALLCSLDGEWKVKNKTSEYDIRRVEGTNMQLRLRKGWPAQLYHGDMRCGTQYPLPRIVRQNNNEVYLPDIISQCDSFSHAPCCRNDIGWCGNGKYFCKCKTCFNYRVIIYTELYDWKNKLNCNQQKVVKKESCDFLSQTFSSVTFIGDSLVRHVFSSLLIQLTNDTKAGALKPHLHPHEKVFCADENQFVDSSCHSKLSVDWKDVKLHPGYCNSSGSLPKIDFIQAYSTHFKQLAMDRVEEVLLEERPLVLLGIGIHDNFDYEKVIEQYLQPIVQLRNKRMAFTNPVFVWLNTHSAGPLKPIPYQNTQGNHKIVRFNTFLREYCRRNSVLVFDSFNITRGVHSFDGTHYGRAMNLLKVELLLHSLKMFSAERTSPDSRFSSYRRF